MVVWSVVVTLFAEYDNIVFDTAKILMFQISDKRMFRKTFLGAFAVPGAGVEKPCHKVCLLSPVSIRAPYQIKLRALGLTKGITKDSDSNVQIRTSILIRFKCGDKNWIPIKEQCQNPIKINQFLIFFEHFWSIFDWFQTFSFKKLIKRLKIALQMSIKILKMTKSIKNVKINQILNNYWPFLIDFNLYTIKLECFWVLKKWFWTFWMCFNQIHRDE